VADDLDDLQRLQGLGDPVRRALYRHLAVQGEPVGRDAAARAVGISRSLAAYHLDRLVDDGLLETRYERINRRRGPGAGRPSKLYTRSGARLSVSVPSRDYEGIARLLADALETTEDGQAAAGRVARRLGAEIGAEASRNREGPESGADVERRLVEALAERGYEPYEDEGTIRLRNCPFHSIAADNRDLVCGMNLAVMKGVTRALGTNTMHPRLDPRPGQCCVAFTRSSERQPISRRI
jgi:predicted ArsR family transcriptional regulator